MKKKQITATQRFFTDYHDIKFKLTAHRLVSENRITQARVSHALLSLGKNGGLLVVYRPSTKTQTLHNIVL